MTMSEAWRAEQARAGRWADVPTFLLGTALFATGLMLFLAALGGS